jgi:hypothetical protein
MVDGLVALAPKEVLTSYMKAEHANHRMVQPRLSPMDDLISLCNVFQHIRLLLLNCLWTVPRLASRLLAEMPQWLPHEGCLLAACTQASRTVHRLCRCG